MTTSRRVKRLALVFGVLLLAGLGAIFWPVFTGAERMQEFCRALTVGSSAEQIREQARPHGYRVTAATDGRAIVHEPASFGRFTCALSFGPGGLAAAEYAFND